MAFENIGKPLSKPKYLLIWALTAVFLMWLYIGPLTAQGEYHIFGWFFAVTFPILAGGILAGQWYNFSERKTCPVSATSGGILGGIIGIVTVACPLCVPVLLAWLGLAAAIPGAILGGPWLKAISLVLLVLALYWATSKK
jgi:hypothetical protein